MKTAISKPDTIGPTVVVVDDDPLFRRSVGRLLRTHGYRVAIHESFEAFTGEEIPQAGCAILDLNLPGSSGLEIQQKLVSEAPCLSVLFLSGFGKVSSTVHAMKAGAIDFLEKPVEDAVLLRAVEEGVERSRRLVGQQAELSELSQRMARLSVRERQVFSMITSGLLNKQAGAELGITEKTIKVHRASVMQKMKAGSLAELVKIAQRLDGSRRRK